MQISTVKHSKTSPKMAKKRLNEVTKNRNPKIPIQIETRKMRRRPNLSERVLAMKYKMPPTKMTMQMEMFFR